MRFVLATGNAHKLKEFRQILAPHEVLAMPAGIDLPPEGTESFADNACGKAVALALALRARGEGDDVWCLGDDSGLEVAALGGAPGVSSARYAGVDGPGADAANVARLLREMAGFSGPQMRRACFVCSLFASGPDGAEVAVEERWCGAIVTAPRGAGGFGYDPVFLPDGSGLTVAEWPAPDKDRASHRALAGQALLARLASAGRLA